MQAINISYLADVDSGFARYIRYAILVGRNIEIVLERSRQGLLRLETIAFARYRIGSLLCLSFLRNLRQLAVADVLAEEWPVSFLKHTLQVPLRVTGALRHFFQRQGRFQVILDPRQNTMDSDGVIITSGHHLTSSYFCRQDLLEQLLMATSSADRFFVNSRVTSDPQPDDTARKGLRRPASTAPARRACQRGWVTVQSSLWPPVEHARHRARVDGKHGFQLNGGNTYFATNGAEHAKLGRGNIHR